jgi:hypothetical protein
MAFRIIDDPSPLPHPIIQKMTEKGASVLEEYGGLGPYTAENLARDVYLLMEQICVESSKETDLTERA